MPNISETEFTRIARGIREDRETIIRHNPIGPGDEVLLWMMLSCLNSYLSLSEKEQPCFTTAPDAATYREAIGFVLRGRKDPDFDESPILDKMLEGK